MAKRTANSTVRRTTATGNVRRTARVSQKGSNALQIQRVINRDYAVLFNDYKKLSLELWRMPATKVILGGVAITSLVPVILGTLKRNPQIGNFFKTNVDVIESKVEQVSDVITDKIADLRGKVDEIVEARH